MDEQNPNISRFDGPYPTFPKLSSFEIQNWDLEELNFSKSYPKIKGIFDELNPKMTSERRNLEKSFQVVRERGQKLSNLVFEKLPRIPKTWQFFCYCFILAIKKKR